MDLLWWRHAVSPAPGPPPVDRKHQVIVEAHGIPLAVTRTGGDRNDVTHLIPPLEAVAPIRGKRGRSLRRPKHLYADRGYDHDVCRDRVRRFEITRTSPDAAPNTAPASESTAGW